METPREQERADLKKIRHYKGTVKDFKNYWDEMAGMETNAFGTPEYQGFNDVHPTRGANDSEHWKTSNVTEGRASFTDNMNDDQLEVYYRVRDLIKIPDGGKNDIKDWKELDAYLKKDKAFKKLPVMKQRYVQKALSWIITYYWEMER
jgi:hypothetical protein